MNTTVIRIIGFCLAVLALYQTFSLERSAAQPDEWNLGVTLAPLNLGLLATAAAAFWLSSRLSRRRGVSLKRTPRTGSETE